jgi:DNA-binding PadR family transcriptional regulator
MTERQQMGKVKLRVRQNALLLGEFTVEKMVETTGFNQEGVKSELRRMREEGFLSVEQSASTGQRGRPQIVYRLTPDPEKRLKLANELEEFYPKPLAPERPSSHHYFEAIALLDQIEANRYRGEERVKLLDECEKELEFAWYEEGEPEGVVEAFIQSQRGRIEYLRRNYDKAEGLFQQAISTFTAFGLPEQYTCGGEYLPALLVQRAWEQKPDASLTEKARAAVKMLRGFGAASSAHHPMSTLLLDISEQLLTALESTRELVISEAQAKMREPVPAYLVMTDDAVLLGGAARDYRGLNDYAVPRRSMILRGSGWEHNMTDPYRYESVNGGLVMALNSPTRRGMGAASAAAPGGEAIRWLQTKE